MDTLYLKESTIKEWLLVLEAYWDKEDTHYPSIFYLCPQCFIQYNDELTIGLSIESVYLMWNM